MKQPPFILYVIAAVLAILAVQFFWPSTETLESVPYSTFLNDLRQGKIAEVSVSHQYVCAYLKQPLANGTSEIVVARVDQALVDQLARYGVTFSRVHQSRFLADLLSWILPVLFFFGFWVFLSRRIAGDGVGGLMSVGRSKAKIYVESDTNVTFNDVAGVGEAKDALREIVAFLKKSRGIRPAWRPHPQGPAGRTARYGEDLTGAYGRGRSGRASASQSTGHHFH
jgi:cell division protease FtsH